MEDNKFVLEVSDLHTTFKTDNGDVSAVNGVMQMSIRSNGAINSVDGDVKLFRLA